MWYKLTRKLLTYPMLDGLAQVMIFAGVLASVGGGFFFVVAPWVMWSGIVLSLVLIPFILKEIVHYR